MYTLSLMYMYIHVLYHIYQRKIPLIKCKDIQIWKGDTFLSQILIFVTLKVIITLKLTLENIVEACEKVRFH